MVVPLSFESRGFPLINFFSCLKKTCFWLRCRRHFPIKVQKICRKQHPKHVLQDERCHYILFCLSLLFFFLSYPSAFSRKKSIDKSRDKVTSKSNVENKNSRFIVNISKAAGAHDATATVATTAAKVKDNNLDEPRCARFF